MRARRKLKNNKGFSLAETLLAVLILLLVATIVANGIPVARNVYNRVIIGASAQLLLSTAVTALRNELGMAMRDELGALQNDGLGIDRRIKVSNDGKSILYYKSSINAFSKIDIGSDGLQVTDYVDADTDGWPMIPMKDKDGNVLSSDDDPRPRRLVTSAASNKNLIVTCAPESGNAIEYDPDTNPDLIKFNGLQVQSTERTGDENPVITELDFPLNIRIIPLTAEAEA